MTYYDVRYKQGAEAIWAKLKAAAKLSIEELQTALEIEDLEEFTDIFSAVDAMIFKDAIDIYTKPTIGDEVIDANGKKYVVIKVTASSPEATGILLDLISTDGTYNEWPAVKFTKTGKHYSQIEDIFNDLANE